MRHILVIFACLVMALPSSVFATCCCRASGSSQCCTAIDKSSPCCCGTSQSSGKSHTVATCNQCDPKCKCSVGESPTAILAPQRNVSDVDSAISLLIYFCPLSASLLNKGFHCLAWRPPSHNRRQAMLCVWLK